jgi:hypothetical protein
VAEWHWEHHPDDLLDGLPPEALDTLRQLAREITVRDSMVYLDGAGYTGPGPGLRFETRGKLMISYLTTAGRDPRQPHRTHCRSQTRRLAGSEKSS